MKNIAKSTPRFFLALILLCIALPLVIQLLYWIPVWTKWSGIITNYESKDILSYASTLLSLTGTLYLGILVYRQNGDLIRINEGLALSNEGLLKANQELDRLTQEMLDIQAQDYVPFLKVEEFEVKKISKGKGVSGTLLQVVDPDEKKTYFTDIDYSTGDISPDSKSFFITLLNTSKSIINNVLLTAIEPNIGGNITVTFDKRNSISNILMPGSKTNLCITTWGNTKEFHVNLVRRVELILYVETETLHGKKYKEKVHIVSSMGRLIDAQYNIQRII